MNMDMKWMGVLNYMKCLTGIKDTRRTERDFRLIFQRIIKKQLLKDGTDKNFQVHDNTGRTECGRITREKYCQSGVEGK